MEPEKRLKVEECVDNDCEANHYPKVREGLVDNVDGIVVELFKAHVVGAVFAIRELLAKPIHHLSKEADY